VADSDQSSTTIAVRKFGSAERALVDALEEPALVVDGSIIGIANTAARNLLGAGIEGRDIRLAIRHPQALDLILVQRSGDLDAAGIVDPGRPWRLFVRPLDETAVLLRMIDRSDAVSAEKMRVDFVANASHELRTPLSTVLGYAETLAEESDLPADVRSNFGRTIRDDARRMLRIIEDLMSLSRIEADRFIAPSELVEIDDVVRASLANCGSVRGSGQCGFVLDLAEGLPPVRGDRTQLIQVLDNLLGNAIRYGCDGPDAKVGIAARQNGQWVELAITDHGPGIPRQHLPRLTERFYRVDDARSRETGGTGLGLAIVKHIIERHRGMLDITSTLGIGTTVTVRLPAAG
jgi:two-component system phosphate regulon sensor histidine kinase PhoR